MRKIKDYFHMILAAVVCLTTSLFSKKLMKNVGTENQVVSGDMKKCRHSGRMMYKKYGIERNNVQKYIRFSPGNLLKKVFFWLQGPGDRNGSPNRIYSISTA